MIVRQLPVVRPPAGRAARLHAADGRSSTTATTRRSGPAIVDLLERLQVFQVFTSAWFSAALVVLAHLDRRVHARPDAAAVAPVGRHPGRPAGRRTSTRSCRTGRRCPGIDAPTPSDGVLRRHRFRVREATGDGRRPLPLRRPPPVHEDGDAAHPHRADPVPRRRRRHEPARRARRGSSSPAATASRSSRSGRPACSSSRTSASRRPGSARRPGDATSRPISPSTETASYSPARSIRVNDPLSIAGFTFHENGFRPAPLLTIHDADGALLWDGPVALTDTADGLAVRDDGRAGPRRRPARCSCGPAADGVDALSRPALPGRPARPPTARPDRRTSSRWRWRIGDQATSPDTGFIGRARRHRGRDGPHRQAGPGPGHRLDGVRARSSSACSSRSTCRAAGSGRGSRPDGELRIVGRADRYVDFEREFGRLLDDLVAVRRRARPAPSAGGAPPRPSRGRG